MKATLAIVLAVVSPAVFLAGQNPSPQQPVPQTSGTTPNPGQSSTAQPPTLQPCAPSKDTCEVSGPAAQQSAGSSQVKSEPHAQAASAKKNTKAKKAKAHKHQATKKTDVAQNGGSKKTVVKNGSTADPTVVLTPGPAPQDNNSRQLTADLLSATDANLKQAASKPLNADQEETVNQIKLFMEQANSALEAGDLDRGHNLAIKAHLLSDDLVKH